MKEVQENKVELLVEVPVEDMTKSINAAYRSLADKLKVPGFRKGKIPVEVIDSRLGKGAVYQEALQSDLADYYIQAVKETGIKPVDRPDIEILEMEEDKPLKFKAKVEIQPKVQLGDYKKLTVRKKELKVSEEDVKAQLEILRDRFANLELATGRLAQEGDCILINFDGKVEGKPFEGGSAKDFLLEIGSNTFIGDFEKQLEGSRAGEIRDVKVSFPVDYPKAELAGKIAIFRVLIKEVKIKKLPELSDELAKQIGEFKSLQELKTEIKKQLKQRLDMEAERTFRNEVLKKVMESSKVNIPKVMIEDMAKRLVSNFDFNLKSKGASLEKYKETTKSSDEDILKNFEGPAERTVKENLVLEAIADKEKIEPTEEELDVEVKKLSKNKNLKDIKEELDQKGLLNYLRTTLRYTKTLDWLCEQAKA